MKSGEQCPKCGQGNLRVLNTKRFNQSIVRYLGCGVCGCRPDKNKVVERREPSPLLDETSKAGSKGGAGDNVPA